MNPLCYWIFVFVGAVLWTLFVLCVFSAAEQVPHIVHETLFTVGDERE